MDHFDWPRMYKVEEYIEREAYNAVEEFVVDFYNVEEIGYDNIRAIFFFHDVFSDSILNNMSIIEKPSIKLNSKKAVHHYLNKKHWDKHLNYYLYYSSIASANVFFASQKSKP